MFGLNQGSQPSVMKHKFSEVPRAEIPRSTFDRSHGYKTTFDAGYLVPFYIDEALPGDTFNVRVNAFARLATPIFPVMDNMFMETHFFAVPLRLVWDNWQKFNGEQRDPGDSTDYLVPQMVPTAGGYQIGSLHDYFGLPTGIENISHSSLWHRAYNLIWNEWFRDQNMQDSVVVDRDDGPDAPADYVLLRRGKRHDYFTSALPWPQKGDPVELPVGTTAVVRREPASGAYPGAASAKWRLLNGNLPSDDTAVDQALGEAQRGGSNDRIFYDPNGTLVADLSTAVGPTINALRQAFQIQKMLERDARGGTRYIEIIKAHFGVTSPDARLQRPEYLGGGSSMVNISPIPQTSSTDGTTPQGNLAAMGTVNMSGHGFTMSFTEHCIIIGLVSVRADLTYQQGLNRMFSRRTRYDFYWPALSHIGEQAVLRKEIYAQGTADDELVFGYQERFAEYRYKPSQITGLFRSTAAQSLDAWHLSQEFSSAPTLDSTFIVENPPVDRVIAVPAEPHFLFDSFVQMHCARPMPVYGVPGFTDHF